MGKAQSKRSLEVTTESKDGVVEEGTGKIGKIEDVDQLKPQMNGDTHNETENTVSFLEQKMFYNLSNETKIVHL